MPEKSAKDIQKLYQAGQALVRKQKYDQAIAKFKRITGSDLHTLSLPGSAVEVGSTEATEALRPVYVQAHVSLAVCYTEKGMFQEAISILRRASQIDPENADALCALGYVYRRNGMVDQAIEAFERALQCNPRCARAQKSLAFLAMEQGRFDDAIALCREAIQADPAYEQAYIELAGALQLADHPAEALEVLLQAVALNPENADYLLRHVSILRDGGHYEEATAALESSVAMCEDASLHLALAESYLDLDRNREAREVCHRFLRKRPRDLRALDILQTAYLKEGDTSQALRIAYRLTLLCPHDPMNYFRRAVLYQQRGDIRQAIDNYVRVVEMDEETDLADRAQEAIELLDGLQLRQILMLACDDTLFRAKLRRDPFEAAAERGFHLSGAGIAALEHVEFEHLPDMHLAWLRRSYH
ncbi:MAG: tetratricopeptide repeat protein [Armatimonadetes bacterium]|nr:tetratricopeptide repeat protein [Armatimonadota bacterium]